MKNIKQYSFLFFLGSFFLLQTQFASAQSSIGVVGGLSYQEMKIIEEVAAVPTEVSKAQIGFQFGLRALVPAPRLNQRFKLQFDLVVQKRKFDTDLSRFGSVRLVETALLFRPVIVIPIPISAAITDWGPYGKIGANTSYALRRSIRPEMGNSLEFEGFNNLFSAGLIVGVGVEYQENFFIELSGTANFVKPDGMPTTDQSISVDGSPMHFTFVLGYMFGS